MKNMIYLGFDVCGCYVNYEIMSIQFEEPSDLLSFFNISTFDDDFIPCYDSLSALIKHLNRHDYDVSVYVKKRVDKAFINYVTDVKDGKYYCNGDFEPSND